jgi:excinuclease ABC subunit C
VRLEALARADLTPGAVPALDAVPKAPGVGHILGPGGRSLLLATSSNLRRWAESNLGLAPSRARAGAKRPKTNLAGIATAVAWVETDGPFQQRLAYERLASGFVPASRRRDLKPPFFLRLDPAERFPRATVHGEAGEGALYGPFRDRRAADKAKDALQRRFELRPCDYVFEPDPALPLGLGCIYAQVRSCAAPCLRRVSEAEYRALAVKAAAWLAEPVGRETAAAAVPATVASAAGRALVVDAGKRSVGLYPVRAGRVLDAAAIVVPPSELDAAIARLSWPGSDAASDWPWLTGWLRGARARAAFVSVRESCSLAELRAAVRAALPAAFAAPAAGGNIGSSTREEP